MYWLLTQHLLVVAALIVMVGIVCRLPRLSAAVRHGLWLVVLVKLMLPPVVAWPWSMRAVCMDTAGIWQSEPTDEDGAFDTVREQLPTNPLTSAPAGTFIAVAFPRESEERGDVAASIASESGRQWRFGGNLLQHVGAILGFVWCMGSLVALLKYVLATMRVRRIVRQSIAAPRWLEEQTAHWSQVMGVGRPAVVVSSRARSPFVWCLGKLRVIWPSEYAEPQHAKLASGILMHELGHLRRRDHWVIWLELIARVVWWWNPLFWIVRRELRAQAEMACDAWVVRQQPNRRREYAESLVEVCRQRPIVAGAAMNASSESKRSFERRLKMIMSETNVTSPARWMWCAGVGLLVLAAPALSWSGPKEQDDNAGAEQVVTSPPASERKVVGHTEETKRKAASAQPANDAQAVLEEVLSQVEANYYRDFDRQKLVEAAAKAMLEQLDAHSQYLDGEALQQLYQNIDNTVGVGVILKYADGKVIVRGTIDGSPGEQAGFQAGDVITRVNGDKLPGDDERSVLTAAIREIRGKPGTTVTFTIVRGDATQEIRVVRATVRIPTVHGYRRQAAGRWDWNVDKEQKIGFLRITHFAKRTASEANAAIHNLRNSGAQGVVLDLRDCPGGMLTEAVSLAQDFLAKGETVVTVTGRAGGEDQVFQARERGEFAGLPVAILTNERTASAAEIFTSCLQDHGRGKVVGERTYGRGIVQSIVPLKSGSGALKLTTASYLRPSGKNMHRSPEDTDADTWGVVPSAGFKVVFEAEETKKFEEHRRVREQGGQSSETGKFQDRQLTKALASLGE